MRYWPQREHPSRSNPRAAVQRAVGRAGPRSNTGNHTHRNANSARRHSTAVHGRSGHRSGATTAHRSTHPASRRRAAGRSALQLGAAAQAAARCNAGQREQPHVAKPTPRGEAYFRSARMIATKPTTAAMPTSTGTSRFTTDSPA
ncbi:hypothetical protein GCM10027258_64630 [Amycolatopsis stemonae]